MQHHSRRFTQKILSLMWMDDHRMVMEWDGWMVGWLVGEGSHDSGSFPETEIDTQLPPGWWFGQLELQRLYEM
jgi:hypothetical protein